MDIKEKIQLGRLRNVESTNFDINQKVNFELSKKQLNENEIKSIVDVSDQADIERQASQKYQVYGEIEYISTLNGLVKEHDDATTFFTLPTLSNRTSGDYKDLTTDFDFYLCIPVTGQTGITSTSGYTVLNASNNIYVRNYLVLTNLQDMTIQRSGYAVNIFGDWNYYFNVNFTVNIDGIFDTLGFPITELFVYAFYKYREDNGNGQSDRLFRSNYNTDGEIIGISDISNITTYSKGDTILGDTIIYNKTAFTQTLLNRQEYIISTSYDGSSERIQFKYNPFIPITIKVYNSETERVNISGSSYEETSTIPPFALSGIGATVLDDGTVIWRTTYDNGFIDPITGQGVDFPFVNDKHYVFSKIKLDVIPNFDDNNTDDFYNQTQYKPNEILDNNPTRIDNLGKLC